ncbi:MAG TPA: hypothetical protein VI643_05220 [Planctomycetota bacterium]|nr:hypothetical protein [Planctomycetota bacterium]
MRTIPPLVSALVVLVGCIDIDETVTLNPDGSGKVTYTLIGKPMNPFQEEKDPGRNRGTPS